MKVPGWFFLFALFSIMSLFPAPGRTDETPSVESFAGKYIRFANRRREVIKERIKIAEAWRRTRYEKLGNDYAMGYTPLSRIDAEIESYLGELRRMDAEIALLNANQKEPQGMVNWLKSYSRRENLSQQLCLFEQCQATLRPFAQVQKLQSDLVQVHSQLFLDQLLEEGAEDRARDPDLVSLGNRILSLEERRFDCERTLMTLRYDSVLLPGPMAECLEALIARNPSVRPTSPRDESWPNPIANIQSIDAPTYSVLKLATGKEAELQEWVLKQSPASIRPWEFFEKAYLLSGGDLYVALRSAFNTLRLNRTNPPFQRKLMDIRGDRPAKGDNSGDWYHFFGTMLAWRTTGYTAVLGSAFYGIFDEAKEQAADRAGIRTMQELEERLESRYHAEKGKSIPPAPDAERSCRVERVLKFKSDRE
jgi:hypothetical protein